MLNFISNNNNQNNFQSLSFQRNDQNSHKISEINVSNKRNIEDLPPELMVKRARAQLSKRVIISPEERAYYENIIKNNGYPTVSKPSFNSIVSSILDSDDSFIRNENIKKTNLNLILSKDIETDQHKNDKVEKLTIAAISKNTIDDNKKTFSPSRDELIQIHKPVDDISYNKVTKNPEVINDNTENNKTKIEKINSSINLISKGLSSDKKENLQDNSNKTALLFKENAKQSQSLKNLMTIQKNELQSYYATSHAKSNYSNINIFIDFFENKSSQD